MLEEYFKKTRTFRRFDNSHEVSLETLREMVSAAKLAGSARNCQPWQYILVNSKNQCEIIFPYLYWAGYLADWKGPAPEERPSAYILCILNREFLKGSLEEANFDLGIASQNMLLLATEKGLGGCRIGAYKKELAEHFTLEKHQELHLVIAIGKPVEKVELTTVSSSGSIQYYRDEQTTHYVPKRNLDELILAEI